MSQLAGAPVRVQFMRWDEHGWDNYGPAQLMDIRGGSTPTATSLATDFTHFAIQFYGTETPTAAARRSTADPARVRRRSTRPTSGTQYNLANQRTTLKSLPLINKLLQDVVPAGAARTRTVLRLRADDRRARPRGQDGPVRVPAPEHRPATRSRPNATFRSRGTAGSNVLTEAAAARELAADGSPTPSSRPATSSPAAGSRSAASPARWPGSSPTSGEQEDGQDHRDAPLRRPGHRVHRLPRLGREPGRGEPDAGYSRALLEEVTFNNTNVTSLDWVSYPILRFADSPPLTFKVIQRTDIPAIDSGVVAVNGRSGQRLGRAADGAHRGRDRQRVLRRDRRPHPADADDAAAGAGGAQGRGRRLDAAPHTDWGGMKGPTGPFILSGFARAHADRASVRGSGRVGPVMVKVERSLHQPASMRRRGDAATRPGVSAPRRRGSRYRHAARSPTCLPSGRPRPNAWRSPRPEGSR